MALNIWFMVIKQTIEQLLCMESKSSKGHQKVIRLLSASKWWRTNGVEVLIRWALIDPSTVIRVGRWANPLGWMIQHVPQQMPQSSSINLAFTELCPKVTFCFDNNRSWISSQPSFQVAIITTISPLTSLLPAREMYNVVIVFVTVKS